MIVTFEGLSCAGKSEAINNLYASHTDEYATVPEFILNTDGGIDTKLCQVNDIAKPQMAALLNGSNPVVLVDRSFLSTICYAYANKEDADDLQHWYDERINNGSIPLPDLFVYLRVSPEVALERAHRIGRATDQFAWYTGTERAYDKYERYFEEFPYTTEALVIDAEQPIEQLVSIIDQAIRIRRKNDA